MTEPERLLRTTRGPGPHPLELFIRLAAPGEFHFYARGVTLADFGALFAREIRRLDALIVRMPPDLLNPNYWEPLTRETENEVRRKRTGIITRTEGDRTLLWRSDRIASSRLLRDDLDIPAELFDGYVFRTTGEGMIKLGTAWNGAGRFEAVALAGLEPGPLSSQRLSEAHHDLLTLGLSGAGTRLLYASQDDDLTRVVFTDRDLLRRAIGALLCGFVEGSTGRPANIPGNPVCDPVARLADGWGLSALPGKDLIDKGRTVEVTAHLGVTPWSVAPPPGGGRILLYYDRTAGLWAVSR